MIEEIPQWAQRRVRELIPVDPALIVTAQDIVDAFARYIAAREQPPVDPDVEIVSLTLQAFYNAGAGAMHTTNENSAPFQAALAAYRKHKEAGE